ncbi:MAG: hypothetical protein A2W05_04955 [Candidatus Schekmanbacteria bacterium RBG_16_38_10]|uniref:Stress response protein n=1 Tax=Candidatus Schekmanbacteria bacterium RBG_16_38_10 TaxID=1817879 RepID=A0A1F7RP87_9BACT|nr:MAG: hypothetical protein A2W05_04955 [Candidatus Schekmanbacteria bacterium RBG_16_38_10]
MVKRIEKDYARFRNIIKGKIKEDLRKYITQGELIGKKGKYLVSIPLPQIRIPSFRYGKNARTGIGQGDGEVGTPIADGDEALGVGGAGNQPGEHILEVDITLEELAQIMGEGLELPRIKPKGKSTILADRERYVGISRVGPESLRHFKRTYKEALKRQLTLGIYDPKNPMIVPIREDKRYKSWRVKEIPQNNAVIIYMMDVSGSMGDEQKEIVRAEAFWIDTWLRSQYKKLDTRYIVHDVAAKEVDRETFYHIKESGGTRISSAYTLCSDTIKKDYNPAEWNIYPFHFSDGDNWGSEDTKKCIEIITERLFPIINVFCYGQVKSAYGSGQFKKDLDEYFQDKKEKESMITSEIRDKDSIYDSIKDFLGKGK